VRNLASLIVLATHPQWERAPEMTRRFVRYGASPRGAQALVLGAKVLALSQGRFNVSVDDLRAIALPALRHRLILNFEGEAEGVDIDRLIGQIVDEAQGLSAAQKEVFLR
jgi:MoxR-like ATPase